MAGDGCGNYHVLLADESAGFIDTMNGPDTLDEGRHADLFEFV